MRTISRQERNYSLYQLKQKKLIPGVLIYLDTPIGIQVTNLFCKFTKDLKLSASVCKEIFSIAQYINTVDESKNLDLMTQPAIIIAGSGMANGGRVMHHLQHFISDAKNTVAFVGYQAKGTLGRLLVDGAKK